MPASDHLDENEQHKPVAPAVKYPAGVEVQALPGAHGAVVSVPALFYEEPELRGLIVQLTAAVSQIGGC